MDITVEAIGEKNKYIAVYISIIKGLNALVSKDRSSKNITIDDLKENVLLELPLKLGRCMLPISLMAGPQFENGRFESMAKLLAKFYDRAIVVVGDTLQEHNGGVVTRILKDLGKQWEESNKHFLQNAFGKSNYEIRRWNKVRKLEQFNDLRTESQTLFNNENVPTFKSTVETARDGYWHKKTKKKSSLRKAEVFSSEEHEKENGSIQNSSSNSQEDLLQGQASETRKLSPDYVLEKVGGLAAIIQDSLKNGKDGVSAVYYPGLLKPVEVFFSHKGMKVPCVKVGIRSVELSSEKAETDQYNESDESSNFDSDDDSDGDTNTNVQNGNYSISPDSLDIEEEWKTFQAFQEYQLFKQFLQLKQTNQDQGTFKNKNFGNNFNFHSPVPISMSTENVTTIIIGQNNPLFRNKIKYEITQCPT